MGKRGGLIEKVSEGTSVRKGGGQKDEGKGGEFSQSSGCRYFKKKRPTGGGLRGRDLGREVGSTIGPECDGTRLRKSVVEKKLRNMGGMEGGRKRKRTRIQSCRRDPRREGGNCVLPGEGNSGSSIGRGDTRARFQGRQRGLLGEGLLEFNR